MSAPRETLTSNSLDPRCESTRLDAQVSRVFRRGPREV